MIIIHSLRSLIGLALQLGLTLPVEAQSRAQATEGLGNLDDDGGLIDITTGDGSEMQRSPVLKLQGGSDDFRKRSAGKPATGCTA